MAGGATKGIADELSVTEHTVKKHLQSIALKVGARTRTSIAHAVRQGTGSHAVVVPGGAAAPGP